MRYLLASLGLGAVVAFTACGDDTAAAEDQLETSCNAFCDTIYGTDCPSPGITLDQCKQACPYLKTQLDGHCVSEYTAVFDCTAAGGVTCTDNGPLPTAPCIEENQTLQVCVSEAACDRFCETAAEAGCAPGGSTSACAADCKATKETLGVCGTSYDLYLQCAYTIGVACSAGQVVSESCDDNLTSVGGCLASAIDACTGYCFSSDAIGCSERSACETSCASTRDATPACAEAYESWLACTADAPEVTCGAEGLTSSWCDSEYSTYQSCLAN